MKKRLFAIIMTIVIVFSMLPATVYAAQSEPIMPMWDNASHLTAEITFISGNGKASATILGDYSVSNISVNVKLYYKKTSGAWEEIPTNWVYNVNQRMLSINESFDATPGREYKIELTGTVTVNGYAEEISKTATAICPRS